ncbi:protein UNUSUAL FLORAL ORGANS [Selaginella moellendorffii]|uniref:protein UNUSUAL FLORAL ORGANS n=1 Tax=Selaginella moellendorffii TaxID=88036 RepID=UPI000D1C4599|nr:protein UNUSUAL FLORAL ORGANS [Selaginella moellendorffii]|eukprot:XP_024543816.1 protein UNUSUAL FLORAL ORGANS [Selaginella moellendorffii]
MAAAQRLQLMEGGGGGGGGGGTGGGGTQVSHTISHHHILLDGGSGYHVALDHAGLVVSGATSFRFDPQQIIGSSTTSNDDEHHHHHHHHQHELLIQSSSNAKNKITGGGGDGDSGGGTVFAHHHYHHHQALLEERLWSQLPEKLVDRVLAMLPLPSFFRLRVVCKRWYSLLFSDSFLELSSRVAPSRHCFLLFRPGVWSQGFLFDPGERSWHLLPLGFLPSQIAVVSSSQGLLCCMSEMAGYKTVVMCNPLTRACIQLPLTLKERFVPTVGLVVDRHTRGYKLLVAGDDLISPFAVKNLSSEVFDSSIQCWRMAGALPRLCNLESAKTTFANGCFYCMNYSPFGVLAYDVESGTWNKIQAPMRRFLRTPNLVECRGRLVMVAAVEKNRLNVPKSIRIWGLQHPKSVWIELERMPQALYEEFMRISCERAFYCIGHGNYILLTIQECSEVLMYDFYEKLWRWLPRCPFLGEIEHPAQGFMQGFAFSPRLDAFVYPNMICC